MPGICCFRCGETLTAPVFIEGKPYGWSCAAIVSPGLKKPRVKPNYKIADSFTFNDGLCVAIVDGKKCRCKFYHVEKSGKTFLRGGFGVMEYDGSNVYVDMNNYK